MGETACTHTLGVPGLAGCAQGTVKVWGSEARGGRAAAWQTLGVLAPLCACHKLVFLTITIPSSGMAIARFLPPARPTHFLLLCLLLAQLRSRSLRSALLLSVRPTGGLSPWDRRFLQMRIGVRSAVQLVLFFAAAARRRHCLAARILLASRLRRCVLDVGRCVHLRVVPAGSRGARDSTSSRRPTLRSLALAYGPAGERRRSLRP